MRRVFKKVLSVCIVITVMLSFFSGMAFANVPSLGNLACVSVDATSVKLQWTPYYNPQAVSEYKVYRDGVYVGSTVAKNGYFNDYRLTPGQTYNYYVNAVNVNQAILATSNPLTVQTTNSSSIKTSYKVMVLRFDPKLGTTVPAKYANKVVNGINLTDWYNMKFAGKYTSQIDGAAVIGDSYLASVFNDAANGHSIAYNFTRAAQNFFKVASQDTANIELYKDQVICLNEFPAALNPTYQQNDEVIFEMACAREHCYNKGCNNKWHAPICNTCEKALLSRTALSPYFTAAALNTIDQVRGQYAANELCSCTSPSVNLRPVITYDVHAHDSINYEKLVTTPYSQFDGNSIVDLIEKGDIDWVWVMGGPVLSGFKENALVGNRDIGIPHQDGWWESIKTKCSKSFFVNGFSPDPRLYDGYVHMVEGIMKGVCETYPSIWPKVYKYSVYKNNLDGNDLTKVDGYFNLWGRFRATDSQNNRVNPYDSYAPAAPGNANCGSSHFPPSSRRGIDYAFDDDATWRRYVDSCADEWLNYPNLSQTPVQRKIGGYDYGAYDDYTVGGTSKTFQWNSMSYHQWWFNHIPHNPGKASGKLNNWWPYIFDFNRFDGREISYNIDSTQSTKVYNPINSEYGTDESNANNWGYWNSINKDGKNAVISTIDRYINPANVKTGNYAIKANINSSKFYSTGRNDLFYPASKNAAWNLSSISQIKLSIKPDQNTNMVSGTNPVIRLCTNGGNRVEYVPKKNGVYANLFNDLTLRDSNGWINLAIPTQGDLSWEKNIVGYIDPSLSGINAERAKLDLEKNILSNVNYVEISIKSDIVSYSTDNNFSLYIDDLEFVTGVKDGGFESGLSSTEPMYWTKNFNNSGYQANFLLDSSVKRSGNYSGKISIDTNTDSSYKQILNLEKNTKYQLSGYIKTNNVGSNCPGATLAIKDSNGFLNSSGVKLTSDWQLINLTFTTGDNAQVELHARFDHTYGPASAWFDDLSIQKIDKGLVDGSFEGVYQLTTKSNNWQTSFNNLGTPATFNMDSSVARTGYYSAKISSSGYTDSSFKQVVNLDKNSKYKIVGYIKTNTVNGQGATISVLDSRGFLNSSSVKLTTTGWQPVLFEFTTGENPQVEVHARLNHSSGAASAWFDDINIVKMNTGLADGGFESVYQGTIDSNAWKTSFNNSGNQATFIMDPSVKRSGNFSAKINIDTNTDSSFKQMATLEKYTRYTLSGYIKTNNVGSSCPGAMLSIKDGNVFTSSTGVKLTSDWQLVTLTFTTGENTQIEIHARLNHTYGPASAWFDDLTLVKG
ncbi:MAG: hypothetical protein N2645_23180 [Clostridia bacterium]|nr:hypothetical protein [Clostridia bacterium]